MKAKLYDEIELIVDVKSGFDDTIIKKGTKGVIIECYAEPIEGYAVDLSIPNEAFVGGYEYENVILFPHQFVLSSAMAFKEPSKHSSTDTIGNCEDYLLDSEFDNILENLLL